MEKVKTLRLSNHCTMIFNNSVEYFPLPEVAIRKFTVDEEVMRLLAHFGTYNIEDIMDDDLSSIKKKAYELIKEQDKSIPDFMRDHKVYQFTVSLDDGKSFALSMDGVEVRQLVTQLKLLLNNAG